MLIIIRSGWNLVVKAHAHQSITNIYSPKRTIIFNFRYNRSPWQSFIKSRSMILSCLTALAKSKTAQTLYPKLQFYCNKSTFSRREISWVHLRSENSCFLPPLPFRFSHVYRALQTPLNFFLIDRKTMILRHLLTKKGYGEDNKDKLVNLCVLNEIFSLLLPSISSSILPQ